MESKSFTAFIVEETADQRYVCRIGEKNIDELPPGDVLIEVCYSSLNYKDALSATGNKGVTRKYPHTPGIDAAGIVVKSNRHDLSIGTKVLITGYDLGMNTSGGFGKYIRVPGSWVIKLPENLSLKESMAYGTAGLTAALSVLKIEKYGVKPDKGEVLVTGATGGVGSMAVAILAKAGYTVAAATGKLDQKDFLLKLGAKSLVSREEILDTSSKPLLKGRWAAVVDTVGGGILSTAIRTTLQDGIVTCCGNVLSADFNITVYPFILRGISLVGIDSQNCPAEVRHIIWQLLSTHWKIPFLSEMTTEISLNELEANIQMILKGKLKGRTVVAL